MREVIDKLHNVCLTLERLSRSAVQMASPQVFGEDSGYGSVEGIRHRRLNFLCCVVMAVGVR